MADGTTCAHDTCTCAPGDADDGYCSDYCRRHGAKEAHQPHACGCGHPGCE